MAIKPITGMLRRGLVLDLSVAFGLGATSGYLWWYGTYTQPNISSFTSSLPSQDLLYAPPHQLQEEP
ncbi:hypothetical protein AJ80_05734 [Polytolypa hystricis UAMH7299]|uniref:Cytochrome c oxidase polypeptide VIIA n=1 Tax=Polytolypa hystricis (strain UAMH7299) TaxID=1447883 RepID=A0A2B7Y1Q6_POLH7|nr:hypothetical protein AJ80_05734 [Polytolypa hystricis UAMH7299]